MKTLGLPMLVRRVWGTLLACVLVAHSLCAVADGLLGEPVTIQPAGESGYSHTYPGVRTSAGTDTGLWIHVWSGTHLWMSRSTDHGATWAPRATLPEPEFTGNWSEYVSASLAVGDSGRWMLAVSRIDYDDSLCACGGDCEYDGEYDGEYFPKGATRPSGGHHKCEPFETLLNRVYISDDQGETWRLGAVPAFGPYDEAFRLFHLGGSRWLLMSTWFQASITNDDGATWSTPWQYVPENSGWLMPLDVSHDGGDGVVILARSYACAVGQCSYTLIALSSLDTLQSVELRTLFTYPNESEAHYAAEFGLPLRVVHLGGSRWLATWLRGAAFNQPGVLMGARTLDGGQSWSAPFEMGPGATEGFIAGNGAGAGMFFFEGPPEERRMAYARFREPTFRLDAATLLPAGESGLQYGRMYPHLARGKEHWLATWTLTTRSPSGRYQRALAVHDAGPQPGPHSLDTDGNGAIGLSELLRAIQIYNSSGYQCAVEDAEDGYMPGENVDERTCAPHTGDYLPQDWRISLRELLRAIQLYAYGGYHGAPDTEDGFAPGVDKGV